MNKLLGITAATLLALTAGVSFADDGKRDNDERWEHMGKQRFCHYAEEYLERYGDTPYFEKFIEKKYKRLCRRHEGEGDERGERGERGHEEHDRDRS
jgi:hypothetical protein